MLQRGVVFLILLIICSYTIFGCPGSCWNEEEYKCDPNCDDFTGASGAEVADFCDTYPCSDSQIDAMSPSQLNEFYNNLGMVTKYPDNFKQYCKSYTCTSTQLSYVNSMQINDQEDFWSDQTLKVKYTTQYTDYIIAHPDFAATQIYAERSYGYTTTIRILESLPSPSIRAYPTVSAAMIDYYDNGNEDEIPTIDVLNEICGSDYSACKDLYWRNIQFDVKDQVDPTVMDLATFVKAFNDMLGTGENIELLKKFFKHGLSLSFLDDISIDNIIANINWEMLDDQTILEALQEQGYPIEILDIPPGTTIDIINGNRLNSPSIHVNS